MRPLLREIWQNDRRSFLVILGWNIGVSILGGIGIVMLIPLLNMLQIGDSRLPAWFTALEYPLRVGLLLAAYVLLVTVKALLSRSLAIRQNHFLEETSLRIRGKLYQAVSGASWESLIARKDSELINLFTAQCGQVSYGIAEVIYLLASLVTASIQLGIALMMSLPVTALVCAMGVCMLAVFRPLRKKSREYGEEMIGISRAFHEELKNQLASVKEVRAYGVEQEHAALHEKISVSFKTARMRYVRQSSVPAYEKLKETISKLRPEGEAAYTAADFSGWKEAAFDGVHFAYRDSEAETLQGMSFSLRRGEILALLGRMREAYRTVCQLCGEAYAKRLTDFGWRLASAVESIL